MVNLAIGRPPFATWTETARVPINAAILDIGAGSGELVSQMTEAGFTRVSGLEPNIPNDVHLPNGPVIRRGTLSDVTETYDFVMANHSFEHMPDQLAQLRHMHRILISSGIALIRIPVVGTFAWERYGANWVQLDAPRHLALHTEKSIAILAHRAGFVVERVVFDSTAFQFWGSDLYEKDLPLTKSVDMSRPRPPVSRSDVKRMNRKASDLNAISQGDQAAFYLRKVATSEFA
jgi:SAM-dependent methyltransferase